jgi:gas vesicle protein
MSSFGKFVLGTLVGGAVGAVIGLLVAPRRGSETRQIIREEFVTRYNDSVDSVKGSVDNVKGAVKGKTDEVMAKVKKLSSEAEEAGRKVVDKFSAERNSGEKQPTEVTS